MGKNYDSGLWAIDVTDFQGLAIHIEVSYNTNTKAIVNPGLTCTRAAGCWYNTIEIGRDGSFVEFPIADGETSVNRAQLANNGWSTVADLDAASVTFKHV